MPFIDKSTISKARRFLRHLWIGVLSLSGTFVFARHHLARRGGVIVLTFHRILSESDLLQTNSPEGMVLSTTAFDALVRYIRKRYSFAVIPPPKLTNHNRPTSVQFLLTFDDGWKDNFAPLLQLINAGATPVLFICPERVGVTSPYWPETAVSLWKTFGGETLRHKCAKQCTLATSAFTTEEAMLELLKKMSANERSEVLKELGCLTPIPPSSVDATLSWEELRRLSVAGVVIGSHTLSHELLDNISDRELHRQLFDSKATIAQQLGTECTVFSYPNGNWSVAAESYVGQAGYHLAFTTERGVWYQNNQRWLKVPRMNISNDAICENGQFSECAFEYTSIWKPFRVYHWASFKNIVSAKLSSIYSQLAELLVVKTR